jgi:16S rRNA processing protein RimM
MGADYLAVARFRKPHGLKGEALVLPITGDPEQVFTVGRRLMPLDEACEPVGDELEIERARPFHRKWLLAFRGIDERTPLEAWPHWLLGVPADELAPPADDEMYMHEIPGAQVVQEGRVLGIAKEVLGDAGREYLVFEADGKEHLVPFRAPIVVKLDRPGRTIDVNLPPGLLEI